MSGRIPRDFINTVLARTDIVTLIDSRIPLRKMGANFSACCPFHQEKSPSFTVSPTKQFYHCFGCGVSGNAISFLTDYERLNFVEAIETLAAALGMELPNREQPNSNQPNYFALYQLMSEVSQFYQQQLRQYPTAIDYLKNRGISGQLAKEFQLGYAPSGWENLQRHLPKTEKLTEQLLTTGLLIHKDDGGYYDRFRERIMFPIHDRRGNTIGFGGRILGEGQPKYLNSPETILFHKGRELYGLYEARRAERDLHEIIVVEGYMDLIALAQGGIRNVVATLGTATTEENLKTLLRCSSSLIFCFDGDRAGKEAAWRALTTSLPLLNDGVDIRFMFLPDEMDPDEFIRQEGKSNFIKAISEALPLSEFFFRHLTNQHNLSSLEGKAQLAKPASELLSKLPEGVYRTRMFDRLGEMVKVEAAQLQRLAGVKNQPRPSTPERRPATPGSLKATPMRVALALLIQYPHLVNQISPAIELAKITLPGAELLHSLIAHLQQHEAVNTGLLLEQWRDQPDYSLLARLAAWDYPIPENGVAEELNAILQRLQQQSRNQAIEEFMAKANVTGLTSDEKNLLQQLIVTNKKLSDQAN